jgi:hypothetical protein
MLGVLAELFASIEQQSERLLAELGPQYLSNLLWAFATARHPLPDAYKKVSKTGTASACSEACLLELSTCLQ